MSIDYSKVKGLSDSFGNIVKITDLVGNVLWAAVKMANLTITSFWDGMDGDTARITINSPSPFAPDPSNPSNKVTSWTAYVYDLFDQQNRTIKIPVGSTIECYITRDKGNADSYIKLNGVSVATGEGTYVYTVTGDATIDVSEEYVQGDYGVISINGAVTYISFIVNGETYQAIEGMSWTSWFASSYNTTDMTKGKVTDVDGNEISLDSVIVNGSEYVISPLNVPINTLAVGSSVFMNVNGVRTEFLVVHQGNPDTSIYHESCNGTWVLMKNCYTTTYFELDDWYYYIDSDLDWTMGNFVTKLDSDILKFVKNPQIPYINSDDGIRTGSDGAYVRAFALSRAEVDPNYQDGEGAILSYFNSTEATSRRKSDKAWWLRSVDGDGGAYCCNTSGGIEGTGVGGTRGVRPAMILSLDALVDSDFNVVA